MTLDAQQFATPATPGAGDAPQSPVSPAPTEPAAVDLNGIDLTQLPQVRALQSSLDRQIAAERAERTRLERELAETKAKAQRVELENLDALDPTEQVALLKKQLNATTREQQRNAEAQQYVAQAYQIAANAGISFDDPRLLQVKQAYPTPSADGVIAFGAVVAQLAREDAAKAVALAEQKAREAAAKAAEQAKVAQVAQVAASGTAATSMAAGTRVPGEDKAQQVQAFKARYKGLLGKGNDSPAYRAFIADMRSAGLNWSDVLS